MSTTIKSKPSALVLDGRQTRIQVGQQIPIVKTIQDQISQTKSVDYVPVGIVLNVRPRISEDGSSVTIQVETIISETEERLGATAGGGVESAPIINNRKVQSFVRVANNTPFIIGGLINETSSENEGGVPLLGTLPIIKNLFSVSGTKKVRREVIVVITPHIIKESSDQFSRVIPQDSPLFDQDNNKSFPNSYRVRQGDIFDLSFIDESPVYQDIVDEVYKRADKDKTLAQKDPYKSILEGKIPGESVLVKKMLLDIIGKMNYIDYVDPEKIIYFATSDKDPAGFEVEMLSGAIKKIPSSQAMKLTYSVVGKATINKPFVQPTASVKYLSLKDSYKNELIKYNKIADKIDIVINKIKTKNFDLQIFKDQKLALKNSYKSSLRSNGFWLNVLTDARQHNLSIERITNTDAMLKSISLSDIAKLANYYFDEKYTRSVMLLAE